MKLTNKQKEIIKEKFETIWKDKKCPFCGEKAWVFSDKIFELKEFQEGNIILGEGTSFFPVIPIICGKCTHTIFLSAVKLGLFNDGE
jgi:hypothetical protein